MEEEISINGFGPRPARRGSDWGHIALLDKNKEFFQICDMESKGFITRTDMRRLHSELPLTARELEDVFDSLDVDHAGFLTLEAFSSGFSLFLHGRRIPTTDDQNALRSSILRATEAHYQSQWEAKLAGVEDEEERHFCMLMESLGGSNLFEDPDEVRSLWAQLRRDEPHLLSNFEEFLARVTHQIKEAHQEKKEMESALQRKSATHDSEIRHLYEEMEAQIKTEKDKLLLKDSERLQLRSQDLKYQLSSKEKELDQLFRKQRGLESQCRELSSEKQESHTENIKLKMTNEELSRALDTTSQELVLAQEQLAILQEQAARLQQEKEMEMYRVTEGLQREKQSLMKQLDLLREMNKHLKDERDISRGVPRSSLRKKPKQRTGLSELFDDVTQTRRDDDASTVISPTVSGPQRSAPKKSPAVPSSPNRAAPTATHDSKTKVRKPASKIPTSKRLTPKDRERAKKTEKGRSVHLDELGPDSPPDGWPLRRVISIEEDHLPHLLHGGPQPLLHQLSEEEEEEEDDEEEAEEAQSCMADLSSTPPARSSSEPIDITQTRKSLFTWSRKMSPRGQPVGKETQQKTSDTTLLPPDRLFKVVLVGNSSVGKTSLLRSFCEGRFHPTTTATIGIDYSVKTLTLDNMQIAVQLWDTAGQERYRSITKQFFRKADGVVVMYDVTVQESFKAVRPWLLNVQEAAGEGVPILLLGNKMDIEGERAVSFKEAELLAFENKVMFMEVSAYTGKNVEESLTHLARVLMEQEDRVRDTTIILTAQPIKKKPCCK
ncbi:EF-hand calcium-binding domain-containing protein 4B isoform X2 [Eucyclogobius newberryi]|uniref:EF-hand calcium-binding domain-containing protein 4B isoform X2 n=1 Tax=Eucyclogobius newberryi TaxID=166745 RepID=UPI003B5ABC2B